MEKLYIITIKMNHGLLHNPRDKKEGVCPAFAGDCTDITGAHHSFLYKSESLQQVKFELEEKRGMRITRIEEARFMDGTSI